MQMSIGEKLRDEGMQHAEDAQARDSAGWSERALDAVRKVATWQALLDSDDVRKAFTEQPKHPNAWGSVWSKAVRRGWIEEAVGEPRRASTSARQHAHKLTPYRSLIWAGY